MRFYPNNTDSVDGVEFENQGKFSMPHPMWVFWSKIALDVGRQAHIFGYFVLIPLSRIPQHILKE